MVLLGTVGFVDDYLKIRNQRSLGLTKTAKFAGQALAAIVLGVGAWYWADAFRGISFIRPLSGTELPLSCSWSGCSCSSRPPPTGST